MPSVNHASRREDFATLKGHIARLCAEDQVSAELRALVDALLMLFELLMAVFMDKHTPKTSRNSSLPPSQTGNDESRMSQPGTQAQGPGVTHRRSDNARTVETVTLALVDRCGHCGTDLRDRPCQGHERRTLIDIVFETTRHHADAAIKVCPHCQGQTKGTFPRAFAGPVQYGPGIRAYLLNLLVAQMLSLKRVQHTLNTLIDQLLSAATLLGYVMQLHLALARWEQEAIKQLLKQPALHADETSLRVDRTHHWLHVYASGAITLQFLPPQARARGDRGPQHHPSLRRDRHP